MAQLQYDVVIVGASFGGVAAALAAASDPKVRVALLEASQWVGGQATSQGVTRWDESGMSLIETSGTTKSYQDLRNAIRDWYRNNAGLSSYGKSQQYFNPGFAQPAYPFTADPSVAQKVMLDKIAALAPRSCLALLCVGPRPRFPRLCLLCLLACAWLPLASGIFSLYCSVYICT